MPKAAPALSMGESIRFNLALFMAKSVLATLLSAGHYRLLNPALPSNGPVPQTFDPFLAQFERT